MLNLVLCFVALSTIAISFVPEQAEPVRHESPIFCNLNALTKEQRQRHKALSAEIRTAVQEVKDLPNGYSFRLPSDEAMLQKTMEWVTMERRCCPSSPSDWRSNTKAARSGLRFRGVRV